MIHVAPGGIAALDVGGTAMKGALLNSDLSIESAFRWPTPREDGPDAVVAAVLAAIDDLLEASDGPQAIGLVVPGLVDDRAGVARYSENIGWRDVSFRSILEQRSGLPIGFGHDVRAGGLAERTLGAGSGAYDTLFMPIGTGISGAMYVQGRSVDNMYAGEIGHIDVGTGESCVCGSIGCLETIATGPSIARRYNALTGSSISGAKPVFERMAEGDPAAAAVWRDAVDALASALATYVTLLAPERVVIGGGLSLAGEALLGPVREALARKLSWQPMPGIVAAALGDNAACLGAGILALAACDASVGALT